MSTDSETDFICDSDHSDSSVNIEDSIGDIKAEINELKLEIKKLEKCRKIRLTFTVEKISLLELSLILLLYFLIFMWLANQ